MSSATRADEIGTMEEGPLAISLELASSFSSTSLPVWARR